ncbi:MAG TPA: metallophosphoesterase [Clostridia bacterium]|nr:metallophosphoesterase [Clostridia bacterium]HOB82635.1 metallophosphoesterase [Peptococcaceae bacterium]
MSKQVIPDKRVQAFFRLIALVVVCVGGWAFFHWQNNGLVVTSYEFVSAKTPPGLDGYRIVQFSDLHNKDFGKRLLAALQDQQPDLIVVTGDLIDNLSKDMEPSLNLLEQALLLAPVYYVSGNNEMKSGRYEELAARLTGLGVTVLDNQAVTIEHRNYSFNLIGISDPLFRRAKGERDKDKIIALVKETIEQKMTSPSSSGLNILLAHRPELFSTYAECQVDLVFTGHAHGGQVRLPLVGGLVAPDQGFFPKYTSGLHVRENTTMVISRGLGNSVIPLRLFNRPELVVVTLKR